MAERLRTAIVDDEPMARRILRGLLARDPEIELVAEGDAAELADRLAGAAVDLVFLDVEMPEVSGLELFARLAAGGAPPAVVFVTAYDRYAVEAFRLHAVDYLLKPFTDERFATALERAKQRIRRHGGPTAAAVAALLAELAERHPPPGRSRFLVQVGDRTVVVPLDEVDWIEAADYYARLHCGGRSHLVRESLTALADELEPAGFCRIHRSALVRLDRVVEVQPHFASSAVAVLRDGSRLKVSRSRRAAFEERLAGRG